MALHLLGVVWLLSKQSDCVCPRQSGLAYRAILVSQEGYVKNRYEPKGHVTFMSHKVLQQKLQGSGYTTKWVEYIANNTVHNAGPWDYCAAQINRLIGAPNGRAFSTAMTDLGMNERNAYTSHVIDAFPSAARCMARASCAIESATGAGNCKFPLANYCQLREEIIKNPGVSMFVRHMADPWPRQVPTVPLSSGSPAMRPYGLTPTPYCSQLPSSASCRSAKRVTAARNHTRLLMVPPGLC